MKATEATESEDHISELLISAADVSPVPGADEQKQEASFSFEATRIAEQRKIGGEGERRREERRRCSSNERDKERVDRFRVARE